MRVTSAEANKILRTKQDELNALKAMENKSAVFVAATTEDVEAARPEYDIKSVQEKIVNAQAEIRKLKHAINLFNVIHKPEGFDMTVDEMLIYIPQLTSMKGKYQGMASRLPKTRRESGYSRSGLIEYEYANYDPAFAQEQLDRVTEELARAQLALDKLNTTETFEI